MDLRLFIAIELGAEWTDALASTQDALRGQGLAGLRWVRPEGIHLTLKFLGNVDQQRVDAITEAMGEAARAIRPFDLTLGALGTFGPAARPRVLWCGVSGDLQALTRLWQATERHIAPMGFPSDHDRFAPHLTLARVQDDTPAERRSSIAPMLARHKAPAAGSLHVSEVSLMQSMLDRGGARYHRLGSVSLRKDFTSEVGGSAPDRQEG
jgi:RNA 2',3'-cyclic 3'-phosphodiesterase